MVVALVGAESTGKTVLAQALQEKLGKDGFKVALVDETLRTFCDQNGRTPRRDEQILLAQTQTRRIAEAASDHQLVIADTTALMTAVYSEIVFNDTSLYAEAEAAQRQCDLTLLMALDLPWIADGLQRDGEHVREPVDQLLRAALQRSGVAYSIVAGTGGRRIDSACAAIDRAWKLRQKPTRPEKRWQWLCERCGEAGCERHWLQQAQAGADE